IVRAQCFGVAFLGLVVARQGEPPLQGPRSEGRHLLEALDGAVEAAVAGVELAQAGLSDRVIGTLLSAPQALDEIDALPNDGGQVGPQILRLTIGADRRLEFPLRGVAHAQMDVRGRVARVDHQHTPEAPDRLVVVPLAPGDVAELAEALDVVGAALQHRERGALVNRRDAERELDPVVAWIELERLAILAGALLQLPPPAGQIAARDVAGDAPLDFHALADALLLRRRAGRARQQRRDVV